MDGVTVTVAVRWPRTVVIDVGPSLSSTVATCSSGIGPVALGTCSCRSSSIVAGASDAAR